MTTKVAILLCTYNGEAYLKEQLDSIAAQNCASPLHIYASDDGSNDNTVELLAKWSASGSKTSLSLRRGPCRGHVANFLGLLCDSDIEADYYAYSDQDDIWDVDKLKRALSVLSKVPSSQPALYCSRTKSIDSEGNMLGMSPLFQRPLSFSNALVQNVGGGNTMVFNRAAGSLLKTAGALDVVSHDWWTYLLLAAAGGVLIYDPIPGISYRQHENNIVGSNRSWKERSTRVQLMLRDRSRNWNDRNISALQQVENLISEKNRYILDEFQRSRDKNLFHRLLGIHRAGLYAQTNWGNIGLIAATLLKKI